MKRYLKLLGMVVIYSVFILSSVSDAVNLKKGIIGKWFSKKGKERLEFLKDGTGIMESSAGDFKFIDDNRITMDIKSMVGQSAMVFEISIDHAGKLILKEPTGNENRYLMEKAKLAQMEVERAREKARIKKIKDSFVFSDLNVLDKRTKLTWTRDTNIAGKEMNWNDALKFIEQLNEQKYAGYSDWRLPSIEEFGTLVNFAESHGYLENLHDLFNKLGFKNVQSYIYWSSPDGIFSAGYLWQVYKDGGYAYGGIVGGYKPTDTLYVWPVRAGQ